MHHEHSTFTPEARALVARRLTPFAVGWTAAMAMWVAVFALEGRLDVLAAALVGGAVLILYAAIRATAADPHGRRVVPIAVGACIALGLASIGVVAAAGAYGEILAFMLLTLYLAAALSFAWGWRAELVLLAATLGPWALVLDRSPLFVPRLELAAAVTIGAWLALAIAEGSARSARQVWQRRRREEEAAAALQASRDAYRDLAENARDMIWSSDRAGRVTYANEALLGFHGVSDAGLLGHTIREFATAHPDNPDVDVIIARGLAGEVLPPMLIECVTPRGPRWVEIMASAVRDATGAVTGFRGINRDVQERRQTEAALRESEERFRSAFDDAAIGMALTTVDGRTIRVNPALCAMLGYSEAELLTRTIEDVVHPDDRTPVEADRERLIAGTAQSYRADRRYLDKHGRTLWVHVTASIVRDAAGAPLYYLGQIQDITERHRAEEALQESLEKLRLLARRQVAIREEERTRLGFDLHDDVCQELVGVGILVEALRRKLAPMPAEHAAEFERIVRYLAGVVEHLRLLARDLRPFLLQDLGLDGSLGSLAVGMSTPTLAITTRIAAPIPRLDAETEVTVYRVAQEALSNAVRHAAARTIVVTLAISGGELTLEVRDDGRGFDPVARKAMPLGLAGMEERALALGGRLEIRSAPGEGTTVILRCPVAPPADDVREPGGSSPTRSSSPPSTATTPRAAARDSPGRSRAG